jgi:hypothetical protein
VSRLILSGFNGVSQLTFIFSNYLDIPSLLDLGCKTVANMIKGKTPEEIRSTFGIGK